jgi:hypothetical protein
VDRTFNLNLNISKAILQFFLDRWQPDLFVHFEMVPDRLPEALRELIAKFPPGGVQLEVGIQTFNTEVGKNISRRQDYTKLADNFRYLREHTGVHIHADLIVGLPGETLESFAAGFDRLIALKPQEIQVGILKRLRGTPIVRHDKEFTMLYSAQTPYEILQNRDLDFATMQKMRRFARFWDLVGNSGNFVETTALIWHEQPSAFNAFLEWTEWLYQRVGRTNQIALPRLMEFLFEFLTTARGLSIEPVALSLWKDFQRAGRKDKPEFLREHLPEERHPTPSREKSSGPKRQARHVAV